MKKVIMLIIVIAALAIPAMAGDNGQGRTKAGALFGYPTGVAATIGFPIGSSTEVNGIVGFGWNFNYLAAGANFLWTLWEPVIEGETFPLSLGPEAIVFVPLNNHSILGLGIYANLRWEYTFDFPLNLFVEAGLGADIFFWDSGTVAGFDAKGGVGARYVF